MKAPALLLCLTAVTALTATAVNASDVRFNLGINIPAVPVQVAYYTPTTRVIIDEPMEFIPLPGFGFSAAVGTSQDIFSIGSHYYLNRGDSWFRGRNQNGPWITLNYGNVPWQLRRHPLERIRTVREVEYRRHDYRNRHDNGNHRGWDKERDGRHERERMADNRRWSDREERSSNHREHDRGGRERFER